MQVKFFKKIFGLRDFSTNDQLKKLCAEQSDFLKLELTRDNYVSISVMIISRSVFLISDDIRKRRPDVINITNNEKKLKEILSIINTGNFSFNTKNIEKIHSIINRLITNELTNGEYLRVGGWGGC